MSDTIRCPWCGDDPLYVHYHDTEWGIPIHDDCVLFEFLILEGAQAGLSWITVLRKREDYRKAFHNWDISRIAEMTDDELENILQNPRIIRNRLKIFSVRKNAQIALQIQEEFGSLDRYFWNSGWFHHSELEKNPVGLKKVSSGSFVPQDDTNKRSFPLINHGDTMRDFPTRSDISDKISKDLKKRGMSFVGSTIIYAFMQATGMVDDHIDSCFRKGK